MKQAQGQPDQEQRSTHRSLERGFLILETVAACGGPTTLAETARRTGLHRSTAHHLLQTLVGLGYLQRIDATRRYMLGAKLLQLTEPAVSMNQLSQLAAPLLVELSRQCGEGTALAAFEGDALTIVAKREPDSPIRIMQNVGSTRPIHASAAGKAILAWLKEPDRSRVLAQIAFEKLTANTITSRDGYEAELQRVRQAGCAIDDEEHMDGIRCISAPVFAQAGRVVAGLSIIGPSHQMTRRKLRDLRAPLLEVARALSERLGWQPDAPRGVNAA
jgi:IclR family transcriptional regulator, acetate operon repressor